MCGESIDTRTPFLGHTHGPDLPTPGILGCPDHSAQGKCSKVLGSRGSLWIQVGLEVGVYPVYPVYHVAGRQPPVI